MMKLFDKKSFMVIAALFAIFAVLFATFFYTQEPCDGRCYNIEEIIDLGNGGYPRMTQVDDMLLVAYSNGSFVLDGINLVTKEKLGPIKIISQEAHPARATIIYSDELEMLICVFNHNDAASCGIAWVNKGQIFNPESWNIQYNIVGPVYQEFFHIGLWEPFLARYNETSFLLYFSNQTIFDSEHPIDAENYYFSLDGYQVVQKIDVYWTNWNGTGFEMSYCGTASQQLPEGAIHYKDGMASSVLVSQNDTHREYIMTFESFPPPKKEPIITMVRISVSSSGIQTLWRQDITHKLESAPFIDNWNDIYTTSFRYLYDGRESIGFVGLKNDEKTMSHPVYLSEDLFGWPSVFVDKSDNLWLAAENKTTSAVHLVRISLDFKWI